MEDKTKMLIAVGASVTANCMPCLKTAIGHAKAVGVQEKEIREAVAIARIVRKGASGKMDKFVSTLAGEVKDAPGEECIATDKEVNEWVEQEDQCGCS